MKKQKVAVRSKAKDSSLEIKLVPAIETDVIAEEIVESKPMHIELENTSIPEQVGTPSAPQMSRTQKYWIATMQVFADCAVQKSPEGIFDVLARNFEDPGGLSWWLWRIDHGELTRYVKGKDIVDATRKIAHELYRYLKTQVGGPAARF